MTKGVKSSVSPADEVTPRAGKTPSLRILMAEGDLRVRRILSLLLTGAEHTVVAVRDGAELSRLLEAKASGEATPPWDLMIVNDALPGTKGLLVLARLRESSPLPPFVLITANPRVQTVAINLGAAILENPLSRDQLARAMKEAQTAWCRPERRHVGLVTATPPPREGSS
jgi:CheY-like chemotaxis protein